MPRPRQYHSDADRQRAYRERLRNGSTTRNKSRKRTSTLALEQAIMDIASEYDSMTVRQLFYQLVSRGAVAKDEKAYQRVVRVSGSLRTDGILHYSKIVDGMRERRQRQQYSSLGEAQANTARLYRRNYWLDQPAAVEIWCEKDAMTGLLLPICLEYGVPFVICRGYSSITLYYESAMDMIVRGKPTIVYYFGDHDPSGRNAGDLAQERMRGHGATVEVRRMAIEPWQIEQYNLPTHTVNQRDTRARAFVSEYGDEAVEVDALPPSILVDMVRECIRSQIDPVAWARIEHTERLERETMMSIAHCHMVAGQRYTLTPEGVPGAA